MTIWRASTLWAALAVLVGGCDQSTLRRDAPAAPESQAVTQKVEVSAKVEPVGSGDSDQARCRPGQVGETSTFVILGQRDGRCTATLNGEWIQEGATVGDYVIVGIDETGFELREIAGTGTRSVTLQDIDTWARWE